MICQVPRLCQQFLLRQTRCTVLLLLLGGCASHAPAPIEDRWIGEPVAPSVRARDKADRPMTYLVVAGDTLYSIAFRNDLDYRDLARWNRIPAPFRIYPDQRLQLAPSGGDVAASTSAVDDSTAPVVISALPAGTPKATQATAKYLPPGEVQGAPANAPEPGRATTNTAPTATAAPAATQSTPAVAPFKPAESAATGATKTESAQTLVNAGIRWRWPAQGKVIGTFVAGDQTRQGVDIAGAVGSTVIAAADGSVVYSGNGLLGYGELVIVKHSASFLSAYGHNRKRLVSEGDVVKAGTPIAEMGSSGSNRDMLHFEIRRNGKPVNPLEFLPAH